MLDSVQIKQGMRLLDLACGPGYVSESATRLEASPIGIDFSENMIRLAKEKNPRMGFYEGDAENLNFKNGSFDAVTMNFGMLHLSNPEKVFLRRRAFSTRAEDLALRYGQNLRLVPAQK